MRQSSCASQTTQNFCSPIPMSPARIWRSMIFGASGCSVISFSNFFFNDTATTEIYTLSLHDALPISPDCELVLRLRQCRTDRLHPAGRQDRKSTRLNSSHEWISYAVFCLKKKNK